MQWSSNTSGEGSVELTVACSEPAEVQIAVSPAVALPYLFVAPKDSKCSLEQGSECASWGWRTILHWKDLVPKCCLGAPHNFVTSTWSPVAENLPAKQSLGLGNYCWVVGKERSKAGFLAGNPSCSAVPVDGQDRSLFKLLAGTSWHPGRASKNAGCTADWS